MPRERALTLFGALWQAGGWTLWVRRTDIEDADYSAVGGLNPELTVDELKRRWLVEEKLELARSLVKLYRVKESPGKPTDAEDKAALIRERHLSDPSLTLLAAGLTDRCWLLASFAKGAADGRAAAAPASGSPPRVRFARLLQEAQISRPDEAVLQLLERHMPAAMLAVYDSSAARDLYERGKLLPGTHTRMLVHEMTGVTLNGPLPGAGGSAQPNVLIGTSRAGQPLAVKLLFELASLAAEVQLCAELQLAPWDDRSAHPCFLARASAVVVQADSADRHGLAAARRYGELTALLMQRHPACVVELPQLSAEVLARGARQLLCALTFMHATRGADEKPWVHMDVSAKNVLVAASGDWLLSDFGSAVRDGGAVRTCTTEFLPPPEDNPDEANPTVACIEFDFDMLLVMLNIEADKSGWKELLYDPGRKRVSRTRLAAATESLLQNADTQLHDCVLDIRARSTLAPRPTNT